MTYVAIILAIAFFMLGLWLFRLVPIARRIIAISGSAARTIRNPDLDDDQKERDVQRASLELLRVFVSIVLRGGAAIVLSLLPLLVLDFGGFLPLDASLAALATWQAIAIAVAGMAVPLLLKRRS